MRSRAITPRGHRRSVASWLRIAVVPAIALACVVGLAYENHAFVREQQTTWTSVPATVLDTRLHALARFSLLYGSKPLYDVEVLASYSEGGTVRTDWLPLSEPPKTEAEARAQTAALKGRQCLVRWNPNTPGQKIASTP